LSIRHPHRSFIKRLLWAAAIAAAAATISCEWSACGPGDRHAPSQRVSEPQAEPNKDGSTTGSDDSTHEPTPPEREATDADAAPPEWSEGDGVDEAFTGHLARGDWRLVGFATSDVEGGEEDDVAERIEVIVDRGEPDARPLREPIESCDDFFAKVRQHRPTQQSGPAGFELTFDFGRARFGEHVLFDLQDELCAELEPAGEAKVDQITGSQRLLSQVGPIVSVERIESRSQKRHLPRLSAQWSTVDLRTNKPAGWAALVTEDSLLEALQDSPAIAQSKAARRVARAGSLDAAISAIDSSWGVFGGWAFHSWDPDRDRAVIHVAFYDKKTRKKPPRLRKLALTAAPRDEHRHFFDKARAGDAGFLMDDRR
jgi:hypothetical protein